jgi:LacI family transcriptional regulator
MGTTRRIAVVLDAERADRATAELLAGIRQFAEEAGHWRCVLLPRPQAKWAGEWDGVLARGSRRLAEQCRREGVPLVVMSDTSILEPMVRVVPGCEWGGRLAARHLLHRGYMSFGCLTFSKDVDARLMRSGFRAIRRGFGLGSAYIPRTRYAHGSRQWNYMRQVFTDWLERFERPVGILAVHDILARYLADLVLDKGWRIPEDVGIVGAGNDPAVCHFAEPALTSVDFCGERVGYVAASCLEGMLRDGRLVTKARVRVPPRLIARRSTDSRFRVEPFVSEARRFLAAHCREGIGAAEVAAALGVSRRTLYRRFREDVQYGSFADELARARVERAKGLIEATDRRMDDIARAAGFCDARYLARVFRQHEGMTPTAYRDAVRWNHGWRGGTTDEHR